MPITPNDNLNVGSRAFQGSNSQFLQTYSGSDIAVFAIYGSDYIPLGNATTMSYSVHREKYPVRRLGRTYAAGYTRGPRTIAGSLVFINFQSAALSELFKYFVYDSEETTIPSYSILSDQLPPFDLLLLFRNESGKFSVMKLIGVEIVDEGGVLGVNEAYPETTMQYIARDISLMQAISLQIDSSTGEYYMITPDDKMTLTIDKELFSNVIGDGQDLEYFWPHHENPSDKLKAK
jgi:hypothetical protein